MTNPLLSAAGPLPYDQILPEHVVPGCEEQLAREAAALKALEAEHQPSWEGLAEPLARLQSGRERWWRVVNHLISVRNSPELREAHKAVQPAVVEAGLALHTSEPIYRGLLALRDGPAWEALDRGQQRAVELRLMWARDAGVALEGEQRARFVEIERELSALATDFASNVLDAAKAWELVIEEPAATEGWPQTLRQQAARSHRQAHDSGASAEAGPWRIALDPPLLFAFLKHHRGRDEREQGWLAWATRASSEPHDNAPLIRRTLQLRKERAGLLGFASHAELSLDSKMAADVDEVRAHARRIYEAALPAARRDLAELEQLARDGGQSEPLARWDLMYWSERLRERVQGFTEDELRPYFPMEQVLDGLFALCESLFGVRIERADGEVPVWHEDVRYFKVSDGDGRAIAGLFLDPYSRPGEKRAGAWMNVSLGRRPLDDGALQLPVALLCCNGTPAVDGQPTLMSLGEVRTLFHEAGHGLQLMLTEIDHVDVSGLSGVEWDAVEIASMFMESWLFHAPTMNRVARHHETGQPLPEALFEKLCASRSFQAGLGYARYYALLMVDLQLHHEYDPDGDKTPFDVYREVSDPILDFGYPSHEAAPLMLCAFQHLFVGAYAAGYYSYGWSDVLSHDAFAAFEEAGLDDPEALARVGRRWRETILAQGGSRPAAEIYQDFRGRPPQVDALLRHKGFVS